MATIIKGKAKIFYGKTKLDQTPKYRIILNADNLNHADFDETYKGATMVPDWYKNKTNTVGLKSIYDIPCMLVDKDVPSDVEMARDSKETMISEFVATGYTTDAEICVSLNLKDGAVYPRAVKILKVGKKYDAYADFD